MGKEEERLKRRVKKTLGLALGGGGARGLAHIGVLKVLEEEVRADFVAGTSAGSLIGALYCCGYTWRQLHDLARSTAWLDLIALAVPRKGLIDARKLERLLERLSGARSIEELPVPFRAVAVDITRGQEVVLDRGPVSLAVRASSSIPGIFEPTRWEGRLLVDGGLLDNVPTQVARDMGAEVVIAVDLVADRAKTREPENLLDVMLYSLSILIHGQAQRGTAAADLLVAPDLAGFSFRDLSRLQEMIERGDAGRPANAPPQAGAVAPCSRRETQA